MRGLGVLCVLALAGWSVAQEGWGRYRLSVRTADEAQRVADCDLGLFSERVGVPETDVIVGPHEQYKLWALQLPYTKVSELPNPYGWDRLPRPRTINYRTAYYRYDEIIGQYEEWRVQFPQHVTRQQIGSSVQGRPIWAYRVSRSPAVTTSVRHVFLVNCGIHAREWISPAVGLHIFRKLIDSEINGFTDFTSNFALRTMLRNADYYFIPVNNPDGYEYTWTNNRMWRKNRRQNTSTVFGVDLNRNYGTAWGGAGSSGNPSSDTYRGPSAWSEPENRAVRDHIARLGKLAAFIDFHSYGEYVLWPWSYTTAYTPGETWLNATGQAMKSAIAAEHGHQYTAGHSGRTLYLAAGVTDDWFYEQFNAAAYTIELRDTGQNGFLLPASQIFDTQNEAWAGFKALALRMHLR
jgi:carboxypeptidase A4